MHRCVLLFLGVLAVTLAVPSGDRDVIVQLFQWNWVSVARECKEVLGPKGYGAVQISPPQEHILAPSKNYPWWQDYQPVSYKLDKTRRGSKADLVNMIKTCHDAGVKVYVDAVINHMTGGGDTGKGSAGSSYTKYDYPGYYQVQDFHSCRSNVNNYQNRTDVQTCELVGLADLATETDYVRGKIGQYLNNLLALGVDGFRLDACKHMAAKDIGAILSLLERKVYIYQEVIYRCCEPITSDEYTGNGDVLEFRYGTDLARIWNSEKLAYLKTFASGLPSDKAVVFLDNHDTQRDGNILTFRDHGKYALANAFMLAWTYGTPKIMSSYEYITNDQGPPSTADGVTKNTTCFVDGWRCEHKWQVIANMVGFHNAVRGTGVTNWWDNGNNVIAFGRGDKGYLIINYENSPLSGRSFQTSLPDGTYCDVIHGDFDSKARTCSGPTYDVKSGWVKIDVKARDGAAFHRDACLTALEAPPRRAEDFKIRQAHDGATFNRDASLTSLDAPPKSTKDFKIRQGHDGAAFHKDASLTSLDAPPRKREDFKIHQTTRLKRSVPGYKLKLTLEVSLSES